VAALGRTDLTGYWTTSRGIAPVFTQERIAVTDRGIHQPKVGSERVVDKGLIALSGLFGLGLEALESRIIDINGNTCSR
jgi:hypothetical protein